jgi:hypothetical protein
MGLAVARRTVFRPGDGEDFGRVADRVAAGNMALLGAAADLVEQARLRNAIATGALITSGRHLQHGDPDQPGRNMEVFTNCATANASFTLFYLLLNGSGVGRAYDDELVVVDWGRAPRLLLRLDAMHADWPRTCADLHRFGAEFGLLPWGTALDTFSEAQKAEVRAWIGREFLGDAEALPPGTIRHEIADSREGWGKAASCWRAWLSRRRPAARCCWTSPPSARAARRSAACRAAPPPARSRSCAPSSTCATT